MFKCLIFSLLAFGNTALATDKIPHSKLKFNHYKFLKKIPEPSDIVYDKETGHYFIVSDHGILFECAEDGTIIRQAADEGLDFEGVEVVDSFIYVSDETPRKVYKYRKSDLSLVKTYQVSWGGAMNRAFESIAYNQAKKRFILVSQAPVSVVEYDENFHELERIPLHIARDMSGARWYNGNIYLLSNLDETIFKCDPNTYAVLEYYNINVLNPEGFTFGPDGKVYVTSDDLQRLYFFNALPKTTDQN